MVNRWPRGPTIHAAWHAWLAPAAVTVIHRDGGSPSPCPTSPAHPRRSGAGAPTRPGRARPPPRPAAPHAPATPRSAAPALARPLRGVRGVRTRPQRRHRRSGGGTEPPEHGFQPAFRNDLKIFREKGSKHLCTIKSIRRVHYFILIGISLHKVNILWLLVYC